jgi:hypothetical protein
MSQINVRNLSNENEDRSPDIVGVSTFSATSYFVPPVGNTAQRPENPQLGDLRFNTDTASLEYYRGDGTRTWTQIEMTSPDLDGGARGLYMGGTSGGNINTIEYFTISTLGNTADFGDLTLARSSVTSFSSRTRGVCAGGYTTVVRREIDFVTISSTGNAQDFGDLLNDSHQYAPTGTGDQTRGLVAGGLKLPAPYTDTNRIQYNTIATTGDSVDFGDLTEARTDFSSFNSSTRSVFCGGYTGPGGGAGTNIIDYVTTQTLGNAADFGDLLAVGGVPNDSGCSNSTRGLICGSRSPSGINNIEYVTIASLGNATDFGDMLWTGGYGCATAGGTRGIIVRGSGGNSISYVNILSTGNAVDFGDQTTTATYKTACSNAHGGL